MQKTEKGRLAPSDGEFSDVTARRMEEQFWIGYRRGFNRFRDGKIFAVDEEIAHVTANALTPLDIATLEKIAWSRGYQVGSAGLIVTEAAEEYKGFLREIGET
jgi:hypothetical protein